MKSLIEYINEGTDLEYTISGTEGNFDYVDLELPSGTMWATCNVGADKIDDYGLLFQWGRTDGYKYGDKNHQLKTKEQNETLNDLLSKVTGTQFSSSWYWSSSECSSNGAWFVDFSFGFVYYILKNGNWGLKLLALILAIVIYHSLKNESVQTSNGNDRSFFQH